MADPFEAVKKLQEVRAGSEGEAPSFGHAYGQKLQTLKDQLEAKKGLAAKAMGVFQQVKAAAQPNAAYQPAKLAANREQVRALAQRMAAERGWTGSQWQALDQLIMKESGYNPTAQNPTSTAYGIGQFLDSTWKPYGAKTSDPKAQLDYMYRYLTGRYGDPSKALQFHLKNNWY